MTIIWKDDDRVPSVEIEGAIPRGAMQAVPRYIKHAARRHYNAVSKANIAEAREKQRLASLTEDKEEPAKPEEPVDDIQAMLNAEPNPEPTGPHNHLAGIVPEEKTDDKEEDAILNLEDEDTLDDEERNDGDVEGPGRTESA